MSLALVCSCGRRYSVGEHLAGKVVRCKQCGEKIRIPAPAGPDIYGLDDEPPPRAKAPEPEASPPAAAPGTAGAAKKRPKSKGARALRGFRESLPRGDDLRYPYFGLAALAAAVVLAVVGGFPAQVFFLFLALAAFACFLWACLSALSAASGQGFTSVLTLLSALAATAVFFLALLAPNPTGKGPFAAALTAALCYAAFFFQEKRGEEYRQPVALGVLSTLLVLSFTILLTVARHNTATGNITPEAIEQAAAAPVAQPGQPNPPPGNQAPADAVAQALRQKAPLNDARRGFRVKPVARSAARDPIEEPPPGVFTTVRYDAPAGTLAAYLTPDPGDGRKHPAIVWITGGDCNSIGDVWTPADPKNDQSAGAYRNAGIVMMFPALRGGNDNPGTREGFLGEVDDVLAAADYLGAREYVDPQRIYLGGHSTGGTLALLVAESTDRFRAVFSFGPAHDVRGYPAEYTPFDTSDLREAVVRSPGYWLHSVRCPTFVFEGERGNVDSLRAMERDSKNPVLRFHLVSGADHFSILAPTNRLIAGKILQDDGPSTNLTFTPQELNAPFGR